MQNVTHSAQVINLADRRARRGVTVVVQLASRRDGRTLAWHKHQADLCRLLEAPATAEGGAR